MRESKIEKACVKYVKSKDGMSIKFQDLSRKGAMDRIFVPRNGLLFFVEFKAPSISGEEVPDKKLSVAQTQYRKMLLDRGQRVFAINDTEEFIRLYDAISISDVAILLQDMYKARDNRPC